MRHDQVTRRRGAVRSTTAAIAAMALAVAACGGDDADTTAEPDTTAAPEVPEAPEPSVEPVVEVDADDDVADVADVVDIEPPEADEDVDAVEDADLADGVDADADEEEAIDHSVDEIDDGGEQDVDVIDPCVLGTWRLDNQTLQDAVIAHGASIAPGEFSLTVVGTDHLRLEPASDEDGVFNLFSRRDEFGMVISRQGVDVSTLTTASEVGNFGTVMDEHGSGFLWISDMTTLHNESVLTVDDVVTALRDADGNQTVSVLGQTYDMPSWADEEQVDTVVSYDCDPDGLRMTTSIDASMMGVDGNDATPTMTLLLVPSEWPSVD